MSELSIRRPVFITCLVLMSLILGYTALKKMPVDLFPDVTFPVIFVQTVYPGAAPVDMEKLVSKPIEDELGSLSGLNRITSQNADSVSYVVLEFKMGTDIKDAEQQVRQRISNIRNLLPDEIKNPVIRRFDPADQPIARVGIVSSMDPAALFDVAEEVIKSNFETLAGVGQVNIVGGQKKEIQVLVDRKKLQDRNLSLIQVSDKIKNTSKDVPIGRVDGALKELSLRASGEFESVESIGRVNVSFFGSDQVVPLTDIAEVKEGLEQKNSVSNLLSRSDGFARHPVIILDVYKQSGANTVAVADAVVAKIPKVNEIMAAKNIPLKLELVREAARPIRLNIADVSESIMIGIALCIIVVLFFLGSFRSTFITGLALPNSLLGAFVIMGFMGFTINILTLLALSLAVGLLIDDAIVVRENIFRHLEMGKPPIEAAIAGTHEVALAVTATTLVVIAVFGPIAFLDGIIGQFFRQFGLTVCFAMIISFFDAFTVAPMLSAYMASPHGEKKTGLWSKIFGAFDAIQNGIEDYYVKVLGWVLAHRKTTLLIVGLIFVSSMSLIKYIPKTFLPTADNGEFAVFLELPVGSSLEATEVATQKLEDKVKDNPSIDLISTVIGSTTGVRLSNKASLYVRLVPSKQRKFKTSDVKQQVRDLFKDGFEGGLVSVGDIDIGGGNQKPINVNIFADNLEELAAFADKFKERVKTIPGIADVDSNYRTGKPEFQIRFDRSKSEKLGVSTVIAGAELRARVDGIVASTYRTNGKEYDVRVRLKESDRDLISSIDQTLVPNSNFDKIPLNRVAEGKATTAFSQINRSNKSRFINIDANIGLGGSLGSISSDIEKILNSDPELKLPAGMSFRFQGQAEDFKDLMANMMIAMLLGVIFIYLVLASLYESFITPFTILLALPLAITGAFTALFLAGKSIDIFSLIGLVMLLGVVAKNSILLVDYTTQMMAAGKSRNEALLLAGKTRLRPILMTSLALIAGTIPIAVGLNEASAQRTSMGVAIIGGLISSTFLTLLVVPAAFGYIDGFRLWIIKIRTGVRSAE